MLFVLVLQFCGKLFYVRKQDTILIPIVKGLIYLKFEFATNDNSIKFERIDHFESIIGGIGLSCLNKNKHSQYSLRNCILFNCHQKQLLNCLKKSYFVAVYNKKKWRDLHLSCKSQIKPKQGMIWYFLLSTVKVSQYEPKQKKGVVTMVCTYEAR